MRLAHIAPTSALGLSTFKNLDFHLCLASKVLESPEYAEYYRNAKGFVILDVPTHEERGPDPFNLDRLCEAIEIVNPNEVVLPDIHEGPTEDNIAAAIGAASVLPTHAGRGRLGLMIVPRGSTFDEYIVSTSTMSRIPGVTTIGITTGTLKRFNVPRSKAVLVLSELFPDKVIHLLGVLKDLSDIQDPEVRKRVRSADTAKLVRLSLEHKLATYGNVPDYPHRGAGYFERTISELDESYIAKNIRYWNTLVRE